MKTLEDTVDIQHYTRRGLSRRAIASKVGCDRRTVKKYAEHPELVNQPRQAAPRVLKGQTTK